MNNINVPLNLPLASVQRLLNVANHLSFAQVVAMGIAPDLQMIQQQAEMAIKAAQQKPAPAAPAACERPAAAKGSRKGK